MSLVWVVCVMAAGEASLGQCQVRKLAAFDAEPLDEFGGRAAIGGDIVIVGNPLDDVACPADPNCNSGSAYVFQRGLGGPENWGFVTKLTASDGAPADSFGSVSISGDFAVIGAERHDENCPPVDLDCNTGSAFVFQRDPGDDTWAECGELTALDATADDNFGTDVAIEGDTIVVGARMISRGNNGPGKAYVFERDGACNWTQVAMLAASDGQTSDHLGLVVSISGGRDRRCKRR